MLDAYPAFAEKVHYTKPVGKDDTGKMKYAEGLSIRAAESLQSLWDNSASGCEPVVEDDESITLAGVFLDYERNIRHTFCKRVSKYYTTRDKRRVQHPSDRFADVVMPANQSKLLRETILRSLPAEIKMAYSDHAKEIMQRKPKAQRIKAMCDAFSVFGVKREQLEALKGKPLKDWTADDIDVMQGVYNGLKDEETTVEQVFGNKQEPDNPSKLQVKVPNKPPAKSVDPDFEKEKAKKIAALKNAPPAKPMTYCLHCNREVKPDEIETGPDANNKPIDFHSECGYELKEKPE
jgi:hypothetical protein